MEYKDVSSEASQPKEWAPGQSLRLRFNEIVIETLDQHFKIKKEELPIDFAHKKLEGG